MVDDILLKRQFITKDETLILDDKQLQYYALAEIDDLLRSIGKSLQTFPQLPQPPNSYLNHGSNNLIVEETNYNIAEMEKECNKLLETMNEEQHSRFKIPILLDETSVYNIGHNSNITQLIKHTKLIIWDEAPMQHRFAFECLDRSLRDIMKSVNPSNGLKPFGGITVVLGGDFRQILSVITHGERSEILPSCITRSPLWNICNIFVLKRNMRLNQGTSQKEIDDLHKLAQCVLDVGDCKVTPPNHGSQDYKKDDILILDQLCDLENKNLIENMISGIYPQFGQNSINAEYLSERAILTPTNQTVGHLNSLIVELIPGDSVSYYSVDSAEDFGGSDVELNSAFPIEYLNSLSLPGMSVMPTHDLKLKVGAVVMLMRNLNQTLGLCNGTRMIVTKCLKFCVECEVICGSFVGSHHFIPRMELAQSDTRMPFKLVRKQIPLQICYAMTINKSQGQSLKTVGLFLPKAVFTHGQFYVALSRVTSPMGLKIFVDDESGSPTNLTQNVVYKEVFYALPKI